jgi:hypothetical protein
LFTALVIPARFNGAIDMIPSKETLAAAWAILGDNRQFDPEHALELYDALTAGGRIERPLVVSDPPEFEVVGTSWQKLPIWTSMLPANGGRGVKKHLVADVWDEIHVEIEENGDGWYRYDANLSLDIMDNAVQLALCRTRDSADTIFQGIHVVQGASVPGSGPEDIIGVDEGDLVSLVARTGAGLTATLQVWSAALDYERRLAKT